MMASRKPAPVATAAEQAGKQGEEGERCPVEEVALVVPETDDPSLPVMTFRAWTLGLGSCVVLIFLNTFFTYRTQPLTISGILAQILVLPAGRFMAAVLPDREVRILGGRLGSFNLNPGPAATTGSHGSAAAGGTTPRRTWLRLCRLLASCYAWLFATLLCLLAASAASVSHGVGSATSCFASVLSLPS